MSASSASWFYSTPEKSPYLLAERVRGTFWDNRLTDVWLDTVRAEGPFEMQGTHRGARITLEWETNQWLRLRSAPASSVLRDGLATILRRRPAIQYQDEDGSTVWEWWPAGADKRWQDVQGKPAFGSPVRLDR